jgi:hypothetical protein
VKRAESRRLRRRETKPGVQVTCRPGSHGLGADLALSVLDISEEGARLRLKAPLQPGQEVEVTLQGVGTPRPVRMPARVAWSVAAADGSHCVGLAFEKTLTYRDFLSIMPF